MTSALRYLRNGLSQYVQLTVATRQFVLAQPLLDPAGVVRQHLAERESIFLERARCLIFANPENPYYRLFQMAGCSWEDLQRAVRKDGLETTLESLRASGVYVSHDEFKGMRPMVRGGTEILTTPRAFSSGVKTLPLPNPSSGSRGPGTDTQTGIEMRLHQEAYEHLFLQELDLLDSEQIVVFPVLPSAVGYMRGLRAGRRGQPARWFAPGGRWRGGGGQALATKWMMLVAKASGITAPIPEGLPPSDFSPVVAHILRRRRQGRRCWVYAMVTSAVKISVEAAAIGETLEGIDFVVIGESLTTAKRAVIEASGATVRSVYASTELALMGIPCRQSDADCLHILSDSLAVISYRRIAELSDCEVDSLLFTTLLPSSPYFVINLEMNDSGAIGRANCDCSLARLGLTTTIQNVFSFGKLTGMGVTLLGSQLLDLLERTLPAKFGGSPGDYQLLESEDEGQYRVTLRISPRVPLSSPDAVEKMFLQAVDRLYGGRVTRRVWTHAGAMRVEISEPIATGSGKVLPLHLLRRPNG